MAFAVNIIVVLVLLHMVIAFLACTAILSIPKQFLKPRIKYVIFSLIIPFFGVLIISKNGALLPKLHQAYSDLNSHVANDKRMDTHAGGTDSYDGGDGGE